MQPTQSAEALGYCRTSLRDGFQFAGLRSKPPTGRTLVVPSKRSRFLASLGMTGERETQN